MSLAMVTTAASGGAVTVDFDATVLLQAGLFLVLMAILKPVLFDPMLKLFEERERRIEGAKLQARKMDEESAGALARYEEAMQKARGAANAEREKLLGEAASKENEILGKVRATTADLLERGRKDAEQQTTQTRAALRAASADLGRAMASRVLGREVGG